MFNNRYHDQLKNTRVDVKKCLQKIIVKEIKLCKK